MKKLSLSLVLFVFSAVNLLAQNCFRIESLLVNACGASEGLNEIVRFKIGSNGLNTGQLSVNWANVSLSWHGTIQNTTTANKVAQMNAQVQNCGLFLEPINGFLPPNATVFLFTSYNIDVAAHSWAGLSDTIYCIFQNANDASGHFSNTPGTSGRTFSMNFTGCTAQSVTYYSGNTNNLQNIDGATVNVGNNGSVSYSYNGCVAPYSPAFINAGNAQSINVCAGDTITLSGTASSVFSTFQWSGGSGTFLSGTSLQTKYVIGANDSGTLQFTLTGTKCNGTMISTVSVTLNAPAPIQPVITGNLTLCQGGSTVLTASGGTVYRWNTGASTASINVSQAGIYKVVIENSCFKDSAQVNVNLVASPSLQIASSSGTSAICNGDSVILTATYTGNNILWNTGSSNATIIAKNGGDYWATTSNSCGVARDTFSLLVNQLPAVQIQGPNQICTGNTAQLIATGSGNYQWSTGEISSSIEIQSGGNYSVSATNNCGTTTVALQVDEHPQPNVSITEGMMIDTCSNAPLTVHANGVGTISWNGGGAGTQLSVTQSGTYFVTASNSCGVDTASIQIVIHDLPFVQLNTTYVICKGSQVVITPNHIGNLSWSNGANSQSVEFTSAGSYFVVAQNSLCQPDTAFFTVVESFVVADFELDSIEGEAPITIFPTNYSQNAIDYLWDFGDGTISSIENPEKVYTYGGSFEIVLIATNADMCSDTAIKTVHIEDCNFNTFIPNAFTPNVDHLNESFKAVNVCATDIFITVFNRWGEAIFKSKMSGEGWDGVLQDGEKAPVGAYTYLVEVTDVHNEVHTYRGVIHLLK